MRKKLNCILLVDDDKHCNHFHAQLLTKMNCVKKIHIANDGAEALKFLTTLHNWRYPNPEIIFLDLKMGGMDGWLFLKEYEALDEDVKAKVIIIMTESLDPSDNNKALNSDLVSGYYIKYLNEDHVNEILQKHFPDQFSGLIVVRVAQVFKFLKKIWKYIPSLIPIK